jgi:feruloyl esterase
MTGSLRAAACVVSSLAFLVVAEPVLAQAPSGAARLELTDAVCSGEALGASIPVARIGEPVSAVVLESRNWVSQSDTTPAHCLINGRLEPVDQSATARPIRFAVALPASWNRRAIQMGGGGMNGSVPGVAGGFGGPSNLADGFVTYGSDSGHANSDDEWTLNDEAIRNLGYLQMKKTHDVAMVLIERAYGASPAYNYYVGGSQGGREGQAVAQRYPADYDGVLSTVPIVGFSTLMLGPTLTRIQEKPLENWVPPVKGNAILAEFMRRCDNLDGIVDGVINDYFDCRALFNVNDGIGEMDPWSAKRCADDVDPNPEDASADACLTSGQIETVEFVFSDFEPDAELANGRTNFGMWAPTTAVAGAGGFGGLFTAQRFLGQEGAPDDARVFSALGSIGVNGFMMQDITANPLDYDVSEYRTRREQISAWLDTTNPDLSEFNDRGGKVIIAVGTDDTIAPSGEQLNYYQSIIDVMGRDVVDSFARFYVLPQTGHGLTGRSAAINGDGETIEPTQIPSGFDRLALLQNWVENGVAPGKSEIVTGPSGSRPMCSYPDYPHYQSGDPAQAASYRCQEPALW